MSAFLLDLAPAQCPDFSPLDSICTSTHYLDASPPFLPIFLFITMPLSTGRLLETSQQSLGLLLHVSFTPLASEEASTSLTPLRVPLQRSLSVKLLITQLKGQISVFCLLQLKT